MPALRTEVTEIVTGLAMLGFPDIDHALAVRPQAVRNVTPTNFDRLESARASGQLEDEFELAWNNGLTFALSRDGLRGRPPWLLEWKGPHRPPGYEQVPADLRVDHVYLISCKYGSNILWNTSPANLFDRRLSEPSAGRDPDWFEAVAPEAYDAFYQCCRQLIGPRSLPDHVADLTPEHRALLKSQLGRTLPDEAAEAYRWLAVAVSQASAERWLKGLDRPLLREEMLWRLLRLEAAPYYVLGAAAAGETLHYRVGTPWDFRDSFRIRAFDVWAEVAGQPMVRWRADVFEQATESTRSVEGHVEIRWSHGRFAQLPEAKVYLNTAHHDVAGYFPLT